MKRHLFTVATSCLLVGCVFGSSEPDFDNTNSSTNNATNNPPNNSSSGNNTAGNNTANNETVSSNNSTTGTSNNGTVDPNNGTVIEPCPAVEPSPLCAAAFTCSTAPTPCEDCGSCDGVCAAGLDRTLGVCMTVTPIISGADLGNEPSQGMGMAVAINSFGIYVSRPGFEQVGEVLVADLDGNLGPVRLRPPGGVGPLFGTALDTSSAGLVVGCRGCTNSGQVYAFRGADAAGVAVYPTELLAGQAIGDRVGALKFGAEDIVFAGSPMESTVLLSRAGLPGSWQETQHPFFGSDVDADGEIAVVATGTDSVALRRYMTPGSTDLLVQTAEVAFSTFVAVRQGPQNEYLAVAGPTTLEVQHRATGDWSFVASDTAGGAEFVALAFSDGLLFAALSNGEVRMYFIDRGAMTHVGTMMAPGVTDLASDGRKVVIGAGDAGPNDVFAYLVETRR